MAIIKQAATDPTNAPDNYYGLSSDEKPTENIKNPSYFYEKDTGKKYAFNESTLEWDVQPTGGGGGADYEAGNGIIIEDDTISVNSNEVPVFNEDLENVGTLNVNNVTIEENDGVTHISGSSYELGGDRTVFNLSEELVMGDPESGNAPLIDGQTEFNQDAKMMSNYGGVNITLPGHSGPVTVAEGEVLMEIPDVTTINTPDDIAPSLDLYVKSNKEAAYDGGETVDQWVNLYYFAGTSFCNGKIDSEAEIIRGIPNNEQEKESYDYYERTPEENDFNGELQNIEFYDKGFSYYKSSDGQSKNIDYEERINYSGRDIKFTNQNSNSIAEVFIGSDNIGESGIMNLSVALDQSTETDDNNINIAAGVLTMNESEAPKPRVLIVVTNDSPDGTAMNAVDVSADDVTIMNMGTSDNSVATKKYVDDHSGGDTNHLYRHNLTIQSTYGSFYALASIYNADNSSINSFNLLLAYLADGKKHESVSGYFGDGTSGESYKGFLYSMEWNGTKIRMSGIDVTTKEYWHEDITGAMVQDTVTNIF